MKYYKITNKEENHYGMRYEDGLNEDILSFDPSGDCLSGGIYFSREDILTFLYYGCWIREVTIPEGEEVYENPGKPKKWKSHRVVLGPRRLIDVEIMKELVDEGANINGDIINYELSWASSNGHLDFIKFLVERGADIESDDYYALRVASTNGHLEVVKYMIENGAPISVWCFEPLRMASECGHLEIVKYLVERGSDVNSYQDYSLRSAAENGHFEVVKYLIKHGADVHVLDNIPLKSAENNRDQERRINNEKKT